MVRTQGYRKVTSSLILDSIINAIIQQVKPVDRKASILTYSKHQSVAMYVLLKNQGIIVIILVDAPEDIPIR
jgi:hypothetical protein